MTIPIVKGDFSDCSAPDFSHYFSQTLMLWQLTKTKHRIFHVNEVSGGGASRVISGQYLTKDKEWKLKDLPFKEWWTSLSALPHSIRALNFDSGCGLWFPNMNKNLKKSMKWHPGSCLILHGALPPQEISTNNVVATMFPDIYGTARNLPLWPLVERRPYSTISDNYFIVHKTSADRKSGTLFFKKTKIGHYEENEFRLLNKFGWFKKILIEKENVPPGLIRFV